MGNFFSGFLKQAGKFITDTAIPIALGAATGGLEGGITAGLGTVGVTLTQPPGGGGRIKPQPTPPAASVPSQVGGTQVMPDRDKKILGLPRKVVIFGGIGLGAIILIAAVVK